MGADRGQLGQSRDYGALNEWERCRPWLEAALERSSGGYWLEDIAAAVARGHMQFWPAPKAALITEIVAFPRKRFLNTILAGGDLEQIRDMIPSLADYARMHDCDALTSNGRRGWERALRDVGAKPAAVVMMLELSTWMD